MGNRKSNRREREKHGQPEVKQEWERERGKHGQAKLKELTKSVLVNKINIR